MAPTPPCLNPVHTTPSRHPTGASRSTTAITTETKRTTPHHTHLGIFYWLLCDTHISVFETRKHHFVIFLSCFVPAATRKRPTCHRPQRHPSKTHRHHHNLPLVTTPTTHKPVYHLPLHNTLKEETHHRLTPTHPHPSASHGNTITRSLSLSHTHTHTYCLDHGSWILEVTEKGMWRGDLKWIVGRLREWSFEEDRV